MAVMREPDTKGFLPSGTLTADSVHHALLIEIKDKAALVWTRGKQACITQIVVDAERHIAAYVPLPLDAKLLSILRSIKSGADETVDPDDSSEDRRL